MPYEFENRIYPNVGDRVNVDSSDWLGISFDGTLVFQERGLNVVHVPNYDFSSSELDETAYVESRLKEAASNRARNLPYPKSELYVLHPEDRLTVLTQVSKSPERITKEYFKLAEDA